MKKARTLLTALLLLTFYFGAAQHIEPYGHISVDEKAKSLFDRFTTLMNETKCDDGKPIPVDYNKISYITVLPMMEGISGYWLEQSGSVILSHYMASPMDATPEEVMDMVYITLAHEIGHSQGWQHTDAEAINLMNPTSKFDYGIVKGSIGADQYIINTYKAKLCDCEEDIKSQPSN